LLFLTVVAAVTIQDAAGLGLSIVRHSGGHVTVESRPEHGTTFRVYLPKVTAE
jgi:signal transduction histidine kinase